MQINTHGINLNTVAVTDYKMVTAKLARVIVAFTGKQSAEDLSEAIGSKLDHHASVVANSFRKLNANTAVGFVRTNTPVRVIENTNELRANYRSFCGASNIMMDNKDRSLWELKEGASGKYLARHGHEDLSSLIEAAQTHRQGVPRLSQLSANVAARREFVAFASASGEMDYGFCVGYNEAKQNLRVVSVASSRTVTIPSECVATVLPAGAAKIPAQAHAKLVKAGITRADAKAEEQYYRELYKYDPDYMNAVIEQIEGTATM